MSKTFLVILATSLACLVATWGAAPVATQVACDDWECGVHSEEPAQLACEGWGCVRSEPRECGDWGGFAELAPASISA